LLSLVAATRRSSAASERAKPTPVGARPGTGAFGNSRSTDEPLGVQQARADESERGRRAAVPWQIPWAGWKDILWRTYAQIGEDRLLAVAAGVVFYGLLALFPAVTAFVSLYGLFAKASTINDHLALVGGFLPAGGVDIIQEQVNRIAAKGEAKLGFAFAFGLALALWSANAGMKALIDALNVIYDEKEKRGFIKLNFVSLVLTAGGLLAILTAVGAIVVLPVVLSSGVRGDFRSGHALSFRAEPRTPAMGMAFGGKRARGGRMAGEFGAAVVVLGELRQLRCDLRLARRCHRPDDVDVDVFHRDSIRCRAQLRDRAPDRPRFHHRRRKAARPAWRCHGGHRGRCDKLAPSRPQRG
jgi:hypothetical protein